MPVATEIAADGIGDEFTLSEEEAQHRSYLARESGLVGQFGER